MSARSRLLETAGGPKTIHVLYGGNFSPPTNAHIDGVVAIKDILEKLHPDFEKIVIYWTPTSKAQGDSIVQTSCVEEDARLHMLNLLKAEFDKLEYSNVEIVINNELIKQNKWFYQIDSIQLLIKKYSISPSNINNIIYTVVTENTLNQLIMDKPPAYKLGRYVFEEYGILFYPENLSRNPVELVNRYIDQARNKWNLSLNPRIFMIERTIPTNEAQIARDAAKERSKNKLLGVVPESIADYILKTRLYTSPSCDYKKGGARSRRRRLTKMRLKSRRRR